ncbi:MAG: Uma2 family endonuclease [Chloroflexota bacterium]
MVAKTILHPTVVNESDIIPTGPERLFTVEDLLEISCRDENRYELVRGKLYIMPPAGAPHGDYAMSIGARMRIFAEDHNLGKVFAAETGFILEHNPDLVRAPDAGFVQAERIPAEGVPAGFFPGQPDLALEIISPNDRASDVQDKVQEWLSHGTLLVWVVEPKTKTIMIYRQDGSAQLLHSGDLLTGEDVIPGFEFYVSRLFDD